MKPLLTMLCLISIFFLLCGCSSEQKDTYEYYVGNYTITDEFVGHYYDNVSVSIAEVNSDSSTGTVRVVLPDLEAIYMGHRDEILGSSTEEEIHDILSRNFDEFVIEQSFDADLYMDENEWKMKSTEQVDRLIAAMVDNYLVAVLADIQLSETVVELEMESIEK